MAYLMSQQLLVSSSFVKQAQANVVPVHASQEIEMSAGAWKIKCKLYCDGVLVLDVARLCKKGCALSASAYGFSEQGRQWLAMGASRRSPQTWRLTVRKIELSRAVMASMGFQRAPYASRLY